MSLGKSLVMEFYGCLEEKLNLFGDLSSLVKEAARLSGATVISCNINTCGADDKGVVIFCLLEEGYIVFRSWHAQRHVAIDYLSTEDDIEQRRTLMHFNEQLQPDLVMVGTLQRGKISDFTKLKAAHGKDHSSMVWHDWG